MDRETADRLCVINNEFYREHHDSFSETRQTAWPGWHTCLEVMEQAGLLDADEVSVFDLACGNLRFVKFLSEETVRTGDGSVSGGAEGACRTQNRPLSGLYAYAVDNCDALVPDMPHVSYQSLDIVNALLKGHDLNDCLEAPLCDVSVSFGFLHHIPYQRYREQVMLSLVRQTRPGGLAMVTCWQFLNNEALREKAQAAHERALAELSLPELDGNDFLLDWKKTAGVYRYCHSFSEEEVDQLIESVKGKATLEARFKADGKSNDLNTYLVFRLP